MNAGPASESAAVRRSYVVGGQASSDDATNNEDQTPGKKPYNIMGYNTPDRTDFGKVENAKDVILAADKADSGEDGMLKPSDFDKDVDYESEINPNHQN